MEEQKIQLTKEKETLFITLYAKAMDYRSGHSILLDKKTSEILDATGANMDKYKGFANVVTVLRARQIDEWVKEFLTANQETKVVYLGCGLDTRVARIQPEYPGKSWYDIDYPEVIDIRKQFFTEAPNYTMLSSSITDEGWLNNIPNNGPVLIIAEGVFEYLSEEEVKTLLDRLTAYFPTGEIIFDVMNSFAIKSGEKKLKESTGAIHKWAVDDPAGVDKLNAKMIRRDAIPLFKSPFMRKLPFGLRIFLRLASLAPQFKSMIRVMRYRF